MRMRLLPGAAGGILGVALLACLGGCTGPTPRGSARPPDPQVKPGYLRIGVSPETTVYVEFRGDELRMATGTEGLKHAEPIRAATSSLLKTGGSDEMMTQCTFDDVSLPVPADQLPARWSNPTATLTVRARLIRDPANRVGQATYAYGEFSLSRDDAQGRLWTYVFLLGNSTKPTPHEAPVVSLPISDDAGLQITGVPRGDRLGIGLRLKVGASVIHGIQANGANVNAQVTLRDARGKVLASVRKPLKDVGFA